MPGYPDDAKRETLLKGAPLHLPRYLPDPERVVSPKWIREAVQRDLPIDIDNALLTSPLDLEGCEIKYAFAVTNSRLGGLNLAYATFAQVACFTHNTVEGETRLHAAHFERDLQLGEADFRGRVDLSDATVGTGLDATSVTFHADLDASGATTAHSLDLRRANLQGTATFSRVHVGGDAIFTGAIFNRDTTFDYSHIDGSLLCESASVHGKASFRGIRVSGRTHFERAVFLGTDGLQRCRDR